MRALLGTVLVLALGAPGAALATSGGAGVPQPPTPSHHRPAGKHRPAPSRRPSGHRGPIVNPFVGRGMWIWVLGASNGGDLATIVAQAKGYGVATLMIKSGDGSAAWPQFNSALVSTLHADGLRACAWQYVYGNHPISEAYVGAAAVRAGADCLLIDAEGEYEGKYVQAQSYITRLRQLIGMRFPVALAGLPYMDYHPSFPYSVFLGRGGAQFNVPQMYWVDIGTTVDDVFAHTYAFNELYGRPIFPLGQVYNHPPAHQIRRFRQISRAYGAGGVSWWDWQEAPVPAWQSISQPVGTISAFTPDTAYATLATGAQGDIVVWAQEHLISAGEAVAVDGGFGPQTQAAVQAFQAAHSLPISGQLDPATWQALLRYPAANIVWVKHRHQQVATLAADRGARVLLVPASARVHDRGEEIPRGLGAGRPRRG